MSDFMTKYSEKEAWVDTKVIYEAMRNGYKHVCTPDGDNIWQKINGGMAYLMTKENKESN